MKVPWLALACVTTACAHPGGAPVSAPARHGLADAARYYPLAVGNRWTYEIRSPGGQRTDTVSVEAFRDGAYIDSKGRQLRADSEGIHDQSRYLLRDPLEVGKGWSSVTGPRSTEHFTLLSVRAPCAVPAGSFEDCVEVEGRERADPRTTLVSRITFAAGVGIVRVRTAMRREQTEVPTAELTLTGYTVAPGR